MGTCPPTTPFVRILPNLPVSFSSSGRRRAGQGAPHCCWLTNQPFGADLTVSLAEITDRSMCCNDEEKKKQREQEYLKNEDLNIKTLQTSLKEYQDEGITNENRNRYNEIKRVLADMKSQKRFQSFFDELYPGDESSSNPLQ